SALGSRLFSFRPPRPPRSPLFPYTTLFRSTPVAGARALAGRLRARPIRAALAGLALLIVAAAWAWAAHALWHSTVPSSLRAPHLDRKSTRLNSSHSTISYAVFCLKKKKRPGNSHDRHPSLYLLADSGRPLSACG